MRFGLRSALVLAAALLAGGCHASAPDAWVSPSADPGIQLTTIPTNPDPAKWAPKVKVYARVAGVEPQLVMAILYNENYKPHDPAFERAWQKRDPDSGFGIANMHQAAFDDTKRGRDFAARQWNELPDDPDLAIEAAAWYLHDLAATLPAHRTTAYTRDDLLAIGYNAGPGTMTSIANGGKPAADVASYVESLHENWVAAAKALKA